MTPAIATHQLTKRYGTAIEALDLEVPAGEVFGFLGPNGAEVHHDRTLLDFQHPTSGTAEVLGLGRSARASRSAGASATCPATSTSSTT
ncbi:MAG: hypothetical protein R2701_03650 [Acidimicrobiales bacterium]